MRNHFTAAANDNRDLSHRAGTRGHWRHENIEAFRDSLGGDRRLDDGLALVKLFDEMEKSPTARNALRWAQKNRIQFIVDHVVTAGGGYYHLGTGVVAISKRHLFKEDQCAVVGMLTHEIRHAWQDYHGLISESDASTGGLSAALIDEALFESDAAAHEALARAEYDLQRTESRLRELYALQEKEASPERARLITIFEKAATEGRAARDNPAAFLWGGMQDWYAPFGINDLYGDHRRAQHAGALGLADYAPPAFEYLPPAGLRAATADPCLSRRDRLEKLGDSFAGVNYIADAADRDLILRQYLAPSLAERYFDADKMTAPADALTQKIRKAQIRARLAQQPLPPRPLPK